MSRCLEHLLDLLPLGVYWQALVILQSGHLVLHIGLHGWNAGGPIYAYTVACVCPCEVVSILGDTACGACPCSSYICMLVALCCMHVALVVACSCTFASWVCFCLHMELQELQHSKHRSWKAPCAAKTWIPCGHASKAGGKKHQVLLKNLKKGPSAEAKKAPSAVQCIPASFFLMTHPVANSSGESSAKTKKDPWKTPFYGIPKN